MSDAGRKPFGDKAKESMTPESSKSTQDKIGETVTDTTDKMARGMQSDNSKSTTQEMADKSGRSKDENVHGGSGQSVLDSAKNALGMNNNNNTTNQ